MPGVSAGISWVRHLLAANFLDAPRYAFVLQFPTIARSLGYSWVDLKNRGERLRRHADQRGPACDWRWTSDLFYPKAYPQVGRRLLKQALEEWPITFRATPISTSDTPDVSFLIGHRGSARMPQLLKTIDSIAAQQEVAVECLVIEQDATSPLQGKLPSWVRHLHTPPPWPTMPYSRSWAFNVGARAARGRYLVCHDNDICIPEQYAAELVRLFSKGFSAARLQRFVFYLSEEVTANLLAGTADITSSPPLAVVQNCQGHTISLTREAYFQLGGHDESFIGWGGEDNEFFDRCRMVRFHECAYLPFLHLYHAPAPGKAAAHPNTEFFEERMRVSASQRVSELGVREIGDLRGPYLEARPDLARRSVMSDQS